MPAVILIVLIAVLGLGKVFKQSMKSPEIRVLGGIFVSLIAVGTFFYHYYETFSWLDSLYFSVITLSTVGYGDFTPQTAAGKVFTMVYILVGIGILVSRVNALGKNIVEQRLEKRRKKRKK